LTENKGRIAMSTTRVLVPLDGSPLAEQVIPYAAALAGTDGELLFLHVVPEVEPLRGLFGTQIASGDEVLNMAKENGRTLMAETVGRWKDELSIDPIVIVESGDPAEVTLDVARSAGATMLALASHGRGMAGRVAFGSVADRLARTSPIPALIIHPVSESDPHLAAISRIVVPLDGSDIANEALSVARDIAASTSASLLLVSAVNPAAVLVPAPAGAAYYPEELYTEIFEDMTSAATDALTEASGELSGVDVTTKVVEGAAADAVQSVLQPGDLIVMTSHGRSGFRRWLLGSVSEKLIRSGAAPVVLVPAKDRVATSS
jgi:nucleotide-binding universal stress UspA family protein